VFKFVSTKGGFNFDDVKVKISRTSSSDKNSFQLYFSAIVLSEIFNNGVTKLNFVLFSSCCKKFCVLG